MAHDPAAQGIVRLLKAWSRGELLQIRDKEIEHEVKAICHLAADWNLTIVWLWKDRNHPIMRQADFLSRYCPQLPADQAQMLQVLVTSVKDCVPEPDAIFSQELDSFMRFR